MAVFDMVPDFCQLFTIVLYLPQHIFHPVKTDNNGMAQLGTTNRRFLSI
jgi:hypothetical protein